MNRNSSRFDPELIEILTGAGVPQEARSLSAFASAGILTPDDLLGANDMMLRSLGVRKEPRAKLKNWISTYLCHFKMHIYSGELDVGKPLEVRSNLEFHEWEPFLNKPIGPSEPAVFNKLAIVLAESGLKLQNVAVSLNLPFASMKVILVPVNSRKKGKKSAGGYKTWQTQVPKFDDRGLVEPQFEEGTSFDRGSVVTPPFPKEAPPPSRPISPAVAKELGKMDRQSLLLRQQRANHVELKTNATRRDALTASAAAAATANSAARVQWDLRQKHKEKLRKLHSNEDGVPRPVSSQFPHPKRTPSRAHEERMTVVLKPSTAHALERLADAHDEHNPTTFASAVAVSALFSPSHGASPMSPSVPGDTVVAVVDTSSVPFMPAARRGSTPVRWPSSPPGSVSLNSSRSTPLFNARHGCGSSTAGSLATSSSSSRSSRRKSQPLTRRDHESPQSSSPQLGSPAAHGSGRYYHTFQSLSSGLNCIPPATRSVAPGLTALERMGLSVPESFVASVTTTRTASAGGAGAGGAGGSEFGKAGGGDLQRPSSSVVFPPHASSASLLSAGGSRNSGMMAASVTERRSTSRLVTGRNSHAASFSERLRAGTGDRGAAYTPVSNIGARNSISPSIATKFRPVFW